MPQRLVGYSGLYFAKQERVAGDSAGTIEKAQADDSPGQASLVAQVNIDQSAAFASVP
jgi:hypothetical protein